MTDFSKMKFEQRVIEPGWSEVRIVSPFSPDHPTPEMKLAGNEARKRLIRYILSSASSFVPHLAKKLHRIASQMEKAVDAEGAPN